MTKKQIIETLERFVKEDEQEKYAVALSIKDTLNGQAVTFKHGQSTAFCEAVLCLVQDDVSESDLAIIGAYCTAASHGIVDDIEPAKFKDYIDGCVGVYKLKMNKPTAKGLS